MFAVKTKVHNIFYRVIISQDVGGNVIASARLSAAVYTVMSSMHLVSCLSDIGPFNFFLGFSQTAKTHTEP